MSLAQTAIVSGAALLLIVLLGWRCWRIFCPRPSALDHPVLFFGLVFAAMLALRWGMISLNNELNPDESQMLAQAMRYLSHPVPWRDVDGTTSGPLNSLALSVPLWCGAPAAWKTDRLVLFAINCAVVLFSYLSLRRFLTRPEAQFSLIPLLLFFCLTRSSDFAHYSSETLPSGLISACFYLLARQWGMAKISRGSMFVLGILLGAIPFAKLQCVPLGMFLGATALVLIFAKRHEAGKASAEWLVEIGMLVGGVIVVPALILGAVAANRELGDFWTSYIVSSRKYAAADHVLASGKLAGMPPLIKRIIFVGYILVFPANLGIFFLSGMGALAILAGIYRYKKSPFPADVRWPLGTVMIYAALTILCFFAAGKPFAHYGMLMIPPLALFIGLVFFAGKTALGWGGEGEAKPGLSAKRWLMGFTVLAIGLQAYLAPLRIYNCITIERTLVPSHWVPAWSTMVRSASRPGDTLSVWGWLAECYVRTGLPPATRDAIGHYVVSEGPLQQYYRDRHLRDLEHSKPAIFIDAMADGTMLWDRWTAAQKHECFPELAKFIDDNYSLVASYQMRPKVKVGSMRIYVLKQRVNELHLPVIAASAPPMIDYPPGEPVDPPENSSDK